MIGRLLCALKGHRPSPMTYVSLTRVADGSPMTLRLCTRSGCNAWFEVEKY